MTDRFASQMRQHLLETADVRPADGQLAKVIDGVAATTQRHSLTARLTWSPGRIGPLPTAVIRYGLIAVALVLATVGGASLAGGARQASSVFEGTWITIDPADGSGMTLVVGPGQEPAVYFEDGYATGRACVNDVVKRFTARGTGKISGNSLVATFPEGGGCGLTTVEIRGFYEYDQRGDTLSDQDGVVWSRALGEQRKTQVPETPTPTASLEVPVPSNTPRPSPRSGDVTYTSAMHGLSIDLPASWQVRPATESWNGEALSFDSPAADIAFDPSLGDDMYLIVASQPYGGLSEDAWRDKNLRWLCGEEGGSFGNVHVDDVTAFARGCGATHSVQPFTDTRGYLIAVVGHDWDWLRPVVQTVDLRPEEAVDEPRPSLSGCREYADGGTYSAAAGPLSLSVTVPDGPDITWHGLADSFYLLRAPCLFGGPVWLEATPVGQVYPDACHRVGTSVETDTPAAAIAALAAQTGVDAAGPTEVTLGGYGAARFDLSMPAGVDPAACTDGVIQPFDGVANDLPATVYVIDVDGVALGLVIHWSDDDRPALAAEVDAILTSLHVEPS